MQSAVAKTNDFLLAGKKLQSSSVVHLLLSSSFGLNAVFYAAWLGYSVGIWALIIQLAWSISFFLLIPVSKHFSNINSLHDFLGQRFGRNTKILAAICSLFGINYLIAWEASIDKSVIAPLLPQIGIMVNPDFLATLLITVFALLTIMYTLFFGLRGNAFVDKFLNFIKIFILVAICIICIYQFLRLPSQLIFNSIFPSFNKVIVNVGIIGFITNIIFSLSWQFVDNSSWQSIIGGSKVSEKSTSQNLKYSGFFIFLTVNCLATILGISLAAHTNITPDNILSITASILSSYKILLASGIIVLSIFSLMSLVDGMLLTSSSILNIDILSSFKRTARFNDKTRAKLAKFSVIIFGLLAIWGIEYVFQVLGVNLFDFVYIVIISQLSLIGPVLIGIYSKTAKSKFMWIAILMGLIVGFGSAVIGSTSRYTLLVDGAGTFSAMASMSFAVIIYKFNKVFKLN